MMFIFLNLKVRSGEIFHIIDLSTFFCVPVSGSFKCNRNNHRQVYKSGLSQEPDTSHTDTTEYNTYRGIKYISESERKTSNPL